MRGFLVLLLVVCSLLGPAHAQDAIAAGDQAAIRSVILQQMDAFRRDDANGAFGFAAPTIQSMFGSADRFLDMVQRGYKPVYRPRSVDFAALSQVDGAIVQDVELIGPDGLPYTARYTMEREADGSWRISACQLVESTRLGA